MDSSDLSWEYSASQPTSSLQKTQVNVVHRTTTITILTTTSSSSGKYFPKGPLCVYRAMLVWYPTTVVCRHGDVSCCSDWNTAAFAWYSAVEYIFFGFSAYFSILLLSASSPTKWKGDFFCCVVASTNPNRSQRKLQTLSFLQAELSAQRAWNYIKTVQECQIN